MYVYEYTYVSVCVCVMGGKGSSFVVQCDNLELLRMTDNPIASSDHYHTILVGLSSTLRELDGDFVEPDVQATARRQCMPLFHGFALGSLWWPLGDSFPGLDV